MAAVNTVLRTPFDWLHLLSVFFVLVLAGIVQFSIVWFYHLFPLPGLLDSLYESSKQLQRWFHRHLSLGQEIEGRRTARELVESEGFGFEDHCVLTSDGFVLVLHRVLPPGGSGGLAPAKQKNGTRQKLPVLMVHGLMQDSEALLCGGRGNSLALILAANGYDVFVGNNRGNRYSHKHLSKAPSEESYWDFSIDELARLDVPAMTDYVLSVTQAPKVVYVGFSQGTAQAFAALSSNLELQKRVAMMVALSPAARAQGLAKSLLSSLVSTNIRFLNVMFGRRQMLPTTLVWQRIMSRDTFVRAVDRAMLYLFDWRSSQVSPERKRRIYPHIFSYSSVKCVSHWFQMIRSRRLAMFEDAPPGQYIPVAYELARIQTPVALFYGGRDTIVEVESLGKALPKVALSYCEPDFEHLDTMWGDKAATTIFPKVLELLCDL